MENYVILGCIGEGAHGVVLKAEEKETGRLVALKKIPLKKVQDGIPLATLREIKALQHVNHVNIVQLLNTFAHGSAVTLAFEYMPSDLSTLLRDPEVDLHVSHIKCYLIMILKGVDYCHKLGIIHRDLKPANLLISWTGRLKIADFGLARLYDEQSDREYSHEVVTRWYRAPELLYGARQYDVGVDLWAIGCIFGEMLNKCPLFNGENDIEQLCLILRALGTPTEESYPGLSDLPDYNKISFPKYPATPIEELVPDASETARDLLSQFLIFSPSQRIKPLKAMIHAYFFTEPLPCTEHDLPRPRESRHGFTQNISASELDITEALSTLRETCDKDKVTNVY